MKFNWPRSHNYLMICDGCGYRWEQGSIMAPPCLACGFDRVNSTNNPKDKTPVPAVFEGAFEGLLDPTDNSGYIHGEPSVLYWHEYMRLRFLNDQRQ